MIQKLYILITVLVTIVSLSAFGQNATIRGYVYNDTDGEPVIFGNVVVPGIDYATATDINGFYSIPELEEGTYKIISFGIGFDSTIVEVVVPANKIVTQNITLKESVYEIGIVNISAKREEKINEVKISTTTIDVEQVKQLPSVGGEPDIAQYLQVIPGVVFTGDQGGQLYIRGGSPVQTKILLDGVTIYNPFHSIGFFSVFETDILKSIDVHTGAFSADYGGRISAVVDVRTKDGNKKKHSGTVSASPFLTKAILEGPLLKQKENGASVSYVFTGKYSYLDKTSESMYKYVDGGGIPYSFRDFYGKLNFSSGGGTKFNLFGFNFKDQVDYSETARYDWNTLGIGANFRIVPGGASTIVGGQFAYSKYDISLDQYDGKPRESSIGGFNFGLDFSYFIRDGEVKYGFSVNGFATVFEFVNNLDLIVDQNQNTTELSVFFNFRKSFNKKLVLEVGMRGEYYASLSSISPEPRVGLKYNITENLRLKAATGIYSQNLISTKADRDVVDLFTGFLSGPEQSLTRPNGEEAKHKLQKAFHLVGGFEYDPSKNIEINVEGYYKNFMQLIGINRNKVFPEESDYMLETGKAYGLDVLVNYKFKNLFIWTTYSLGFVERTDLTQTYRPHYDRRHNTNLVVSYKFGKKTTWEAGARWNFGSGFPFTRTQGFYEDVNFTDNGLSTNYTTSNGDLGVIYEDDLNAGRLPSYHRLDLSLKKRISLSKNAELEITASVTNTYNRENIFYFDRVRFERVNQLPILPGIAISLSF